MIKVIDWTDCRLVSANKKITTNKNGRPCNSSKYNKLKEDIFKTAIKIKNIEPPYQVKIIYCGYLDITNYEKALLDGLQAAKILKNDNLVYDCHSIKIPRKRGSVEQLEIWVGHLDNYDKDIFSKGI